MQVGAASSYLVESVGAERVMMGTDYPFDMGDYDSLKSVASIAHVTDRECAPVNGDQAAAPTVLHGPTVWWTSARGRRLQCWVDSRR
jgi:hypothetical protein